jgi:hypothetical protein
LPDSMSYVTESGLPCASCDADDMKEGGRRRVDAVNPPGRMSLRKLFQ